MEEISSDRCLKEVKEEAGWQKGCGEDVVIEKGARIDHVS